MQIFEIATQKFYDLDFRRSSGEEASTCPKCSHDRKKKTDKCLGWNHDKKVGYCNHCAASFVIKREYEHPVQNYFRPEFNNKTDLSKKVVDYFTTRGISQQTLIDMKITEGKEFMPQLDKEVDVIHFNYFRNGELINVKYRGKNKSFKMVRNAELTMYNLDSILNTDECVITEGEIDAMSWHECGIKQVISVPNGAGKNQKLDFLDNCIEYFDGKKKIYISTDNDDVGRLLRDELARRLGYDRCFKIDFGKWKDANDFHVYETDKKLSDLLQEAKEFPIEGVFNIGDNWSEIEDIYEHGLPKGDKTGDASLDRHIGFMKGELTMVTGIPGHGKSIYLDQISLGLCLNADWKFALCSPESHPMSFYFTRLIKRLLGKPFSKYKITEDELAEAKSWLMDRYHMIMPATGFNLDDILDRARQLVQRKGINGLIIDPWNRIENKMPNGFNEGKWIADCLVKIINFAQTAGVHVFLVAHPTKMLKDRSNKNFLVPNLYNISGTAHFFNMTHNGFTVYRNYKSGMSEIHIQKVKWEHLGETGMIEYVYAPESARFYPEFGMSTENWLQGGNMCLTSNETFLSERERYEAAIMEENEQQSSSETQTNLF